MFFATVADERRRRRRRRRRPDAAPVRHAVALLPLPPFDSADDIECLALPDLLESQDEVSGGGLPCPLCNTMTSLHASSTWDLGAVALLQLVGETGVGLPLNRTAVFAPPQFDHGEFTYCLRAAVLHRGEAFHSGHYVAFVQS